MIFVTVGGQMPFDRMVRAIDAWAAHSGRSGDVFAQIGPTDWKPSHIRWTKFLQPPEFRRHVEEARVVVAHAGMGSILTALELGKPIVVMPRRGELKETRNDHQVATAKQFLAQGRIMVAFDEDQLAEKLDFVETHRPAAAERISTQASPRLIETIRAFVQTSRVPARNIPALGLDGAGPDLQPSPLTAGPKTGVNATSGSTWHKDPAASSSR